MFKNFINTYKKLSVSGKILLFVCIFLILVVFFNTVEKAKNKKIQGREGYTQNDTFLFKTDSQVYDEFYADIYDKLVFNNIKDDFEVGQIINQTNPTSESVILDIGCGTGHHVAKIAQSGFANVVGLDVSPGMIQKAKELYPDYNFMIGDARNTMEFQPDTFTHIMCLYFTLYYIQDKQLFFNNCFEWLQPGGHLVVHLVNRDTFDPILPAANGLFIVSPQRYAKERITHSKVTFDDFVYTANFDLDPVANIALFNEKFKFNNGKTRKNQHKFYMEPQTDIIKYAQDAGFIVQGKTDLVNCSYSGQYLYILEKPS